MIAVNYSSVRENFKSFCDQISDKNETVIVTRKDNKNVVMISESEYNNMIKSINILKDPEYLSKLKKVINHIEKSEKID